MYCYYKINSAYVAKVVLNTEEVLSVEYNNKYAIHCILWNAVSQKLDMNT